MMVGAPVFSAMKKLSSQSPAGVAALDFNALLTTAFDAYWFMAQLLPATDDVQLWLRTDSNAGASYDAGAADYLWAAVGRNTTATTTAAQSAGDTKIQLCTDDGAGRAVGNGASEGIHVEGLIIRPSVAALRPQIMFNSSWYNADNSHSRAAGSGRRDAAAAIDSFRLLFESGNIASGKAVLYGVQF